MLLVDVVVVVLFANSVVTSDVVGCWLVLETAVVCVDVGDAVVMFCVVVKFWACDDAIISELVDLIVVVDV